MSVQQPNRTVSYGPDPAQFGDLYLPPGSGPFPVVALIHDDHSTIALAQDLRARGYAVWHVEYRASAGWPGTFADVAAAIDAVSLSGVLDLVAADADRDLTALLGGHAAQYPERYAWTSPTMLNSGTVPVLAVHGIDDDVVPIRYGRNYLSAATARHEPVELREFPGVGHVDLLDPAHPKWAEIADWLEKRFTSS